MIQAVVDVVMHQGFLGLGDSFLDRMELLGNLKARPAVLDHGDHGSKMALNPFEALHNFGMALMYLGHVRSQKKSYPAGEDKTPLRSISGAI
jgi:hypothetical protein